jgi:hypothetical protein
MRRHSPGLCLLAAAPRRMVQLPLHVMAADRQCISLEGHLGSDLFPTVRASGARACVADSMLGDLNCQLHPTWWPNSAGRMQEFMSWPVVWYFEGLAAELEQEIEEQVPTMMTELDRRKEATEQAAQELEEQSAALVRAAHVISQHILYLAHCKLRGLKVSGLACLASYADVSNTALSWADDAARVLDDTTGVP